MTIKDITAKEWRFWIQLCVEKGIIDRFLLSGSQEQRDSQYRIAEAYFEAYFESSGVPE